MGRDFVDGVFQSLVVGVVFFTVNSLLLGYAFQAHPSIYPMTVGKGSWWVGRTWPIVILYVGILAPVLEEAVFRLGMLRAFRDRGHVLTGLLASSAAFGGYHMLFGWGPIKALDMAVFGFVLGRLYLRFGMNGCLTAHLVNNYLALLAFATV